MVWSGVVSFGFTSSVVIEAVDPTDSVVEEEFTDTEEDKVVCVFVVWFSVGVTIVVSPCGVVTGETVDVSSLLEDVSSVLETEISGVDDELTIAVASVMAEVLTFAVGDALADVMMLESAGSVEVWNVETSVVSSGLVVDTSVLLESQSVVANVVDPFSDSVPVYGSDVGSIDEFPGDVSEPDVTEEETVEVSSVGDVVGNVDDQLVNSVRDPLDVGSTDE